LKSGLTSFDIGAIVYELNKTIVGARVENIYQTNSFTLVFRVHQPNQPALQLLIESGRRIYLTSYVLSKPVTPPAFAMALRKHLKNSRITEIKQHEFERIVTIKISTREGSFSLVTEFFGDGNIILIDPQNKIPVCLDLSRNARPQHNSRRKICTGAVKRKKPSEHKSARPLRAQDFWTLRGGSGTDQNPEHRRNIRRRNSAESRS